MNGPCLSLSPGRRLSLAPWRDVEVPAPAPAGRAGCDPFVNTQGQLCISCILRLPTAPFPIPGPSSGTSASFVHLPRPRPAAGSGPSGLGCPACSLRAPPGGPPCAAQTAASSPGPLRAAQAFARPDPSSASALWLPLQTLPALLPGSSLPAHARPGPAA